LPPADSRYGRRNCWGRRDRMTLLDLEALRRAHVTDVRLVPGSAITLRGRYQQKKPEWRPRHELAFPERAVQS
jgi:hypothetical protein